MAKSADKTQDYAKEYIGELVEKYKKLTPEDIRKYKEEGTKKDFILPLFRALGWNVDSGYEVPAETDASGGRVDYAFRIEGVTKFYLEAKKLREDLNNPEFAKQALNYAYHKGIPWVILTDFQGLKIFNAEWDYKSDYRRNQFKEFTYEEYLTRFEELWLLSRESSKKGLLDLEAARTNAAPKKIPVDQAIAADLAKWRGELSDQVRHWNEKLLLSQKDIDQSVQRMLDRFIFIRTTEDRKIEDSVLKSAVFQWRDIHKRKEGWLVKKLREDYRHFDEVYNSELFKMHTVDTLDFVEEDLAKIILEMYESKQGIVYDFQAINADVLGRIYEQYLGFIQNKDDEEASGKNSKRKKHGIYYTPTYIVEYIVQNTLGKILKEKSLREVKELKILDPACGSGSFLIKVFQVMDDWIRAEENRPSDANNDFLRKVQILLGNIYGVDLDPEASEIARLNLLLRTLTARAKLPELSKNIKTGNSLISGDTKELEKYFGKNYKDKKPFDWKDQFPEVFKNGGFDVIIGNPPYVNIANIQDSGEREWLKDKYETAKNKSDLYSFFTERAIGLLKDGGILGFIFSNSWLGTDSFSKFREYLVKNTTIYQMVKLSSGIFHDATVTPVLIFLKKEVPQKNTKIKLFEYQEDEIKELPDLSYKRIISSPGFLFSFSPNIQINVATEKLGDIAEFSLGIKTSDDERFVSVSKKDESSYKLLRGKDVSRYGSSYADKWIWYKPELMMEKTGAGPRKLENFVVPKLLFKDVANNIIGTYDNKKYLTTDTLNLIYKSEKYDLKFILAILNSGYINKWFKTNFQAGLHIKINQLQEIPVPVLDLKNAKDKITHDRIVEMVVKILDFNQKILSISENSDEWEELKSEIEKLDKKIDEEVYKLYGLTEEEIKIVETKV